MLHSGIALASFLRGTGTGSGWAHSGGLSGAFAGWTQCVCVWLSCGFHLINIDIPSPFMKRIIA